jgi:hypothetical protein
VTEERLFAFGVFLVLMALALNARGFWTYFTTGYVLQHWSRAAIGGMLSLVGFQSLATTCLDRALRLLATK